jgi:rfaE bifunctional protein nucleotidyltransferase chain/domain
MPNKNKLKDMKSLANLLSKHRNENKKIVLSHGIFDLLHIGHIRHLEQARKMGDILVVTLTPDQYVDRGPGRPVFTQTLRAEAIASLNYVDYVAINLWSTAEETLRQLKPNIYARGSEYRDFLLDTDGKIAAEEKAAREIGTKLEFTEDIAFSSTSLINRYLSILPVEIHEYIRIFKQRYNVQNIYQILENMVDLKVLIIGDTIIDEYQYCEAMGKSSKDPVLALKYQSHDLFAGGVLAVANHVANFTNNVHLVTILGEVNSHESFIRSQLSHNITPYFMTKDNAPTLIKRRFIDGYSLNKLFEVYIMDDSGLSQEKDRELCDWLQNKMPECDLVISADFGHGTISPYVVRVLAEDSRFLAVNTQANAGNRGFHTVSRYPRADYICIAEHEIRLEKRVFEGDLRPVMIDIAEQLNSKRMVVTRGRRGAVVWNARGEFVEVPAFAQNIVDRVGAGDAFFAVTSLAACQGAPDEILGFIGNVAGALAVEIVGNKKSVDKNNIKKYVANLMK